jgi:hypothetical protein
MVYHKKQWYRVQNWMQMVKDKQKVYEVLCPACRHIQEHLPNGIVTLTGDFLRRHREEILHLVRNEEQRAMGINPLERIITITNSNGKVEVSTTTEKLAQRIGRVVHRAYSGTLEYKWSEGVKFARVYWSR